jgi:GT2 family glycosyltransferase
MLLTVCIISYNTKKLTVDALESVIEDCQRSPLLGQQTEIIVVDNQSTDGSPTAIQKLAKTSSIPISLIRNRENRGFAVANNQAIKKAKGKYILLLNSDTVVQAWALERLVNSFEENPVNDSTSVLSSASQKIDRIGLMTATLLNPDGTYQPQGGSFPTLMTLFFHMTMLDDLPLIGRFLPSTQHTGRRSDRISLNQPQLNPELIKKDWVAGTAVMISRAALAEIGPLDENIFMYGEDVEWCMRAKAHHWDVVINTNARITHLQAASSNNRNALVGEFLGLRYIWAKHKPLWQSSFVSALLWWGATIRSFVYKRILKNQAAAQTYSVISSRLWQEQG